GLGGETIVSTPKHRFWQAGKGWVMARDLKPGDSIRTLGGVVKVASIETDQVRPVFNLDVARNQDYFVGRSGVLAHDNGFVQAVPTPFDAQPITVARRGE